LRAFSEDNKVLLSCRGAGRSLIELNKFWFLIDKRETDAAFIYAVITQPREGAVLIETNLSVSPKNEMQNSLIIES